jgi:hypothetical protein
MILSEPAKRKAMNTTDMLNSLSINRNSTINSFKELGMRDPFSKDFTMADPIQEIESYNFYSENVYDDTLAETVVDAFAKDSKTLRPPKCIFKPTIPIMRIMIKALVKFGNTDTDD